MLRQQGPTARTRVIRKRLPGVTGYRAFALVTGPDSKIWVARGLVIGTSLAFCERTVELGLAYLNGNPQYPFETTGGIIYRNCELTDYRPVSPYKHVLIFGQDYFTVEVQGTVEQASP
jgi:hypothetical protein